MSVLSLDGRRFAAGLFWLERGGAATVAAAARRFRRPYYVHWGRQTGYASAADASGGDESPEGFPSLAASLLAHFNSGFWMALVEADDGRLALVKARDGQVLADGEEVFEDRAAALAAFERARSVGWELHATPGLVEDVAGGTGVHGIDLSALPVEPEMRLAPAPLARLTSRKAAGVLCLALAVAGAGALWLHRDRAWRLLAGPEPVAEKIAAAAEPTVNVAVDSAALVAACRQALTKHPPWLPAWRTERVSCEARFSDTALLTVRPELGGRPVLLARWRLTPGRSEPLHRRIAEEHLSGWYAASVDGGRAWAVVPLAPVVQISNAAPLPFLAFRRALDRRLGGPDARIGYARGERGRDGVEVRIETARPLAWLAALVAEVPGLEILRVSRETGGPWRLEGRRVSPAAIPRSAFEDLTREIDP